MRQCDECKHRNECNIFKKSLTDDTKYLFGCDAFEYEVKAHNIGELTKMPEIDLEGYQSPIEIIYDKLTADFNTQLENNILTAVQNYGINVDRDELIKALNYDRRQYEAGYRTAMLRYKAPKGEWLLKEFDPFLKEYGQCSNCLQRERVGNFCRNCGADMRPEEVES